MLSSMDNPDTIQLTETAGANIVISGGTFLSVAGDVHTHYANYAPSTPDDRGLRILLQNIASEALYDSAELSRVSMCHPNTRTRIQEKILDWVSDTNTKHSVFWLHSRVGEGKTAIMRSVAYSLSPYELGDIPTFFFGKGKGKRGQAQYLFPTLAHQLTRRMSNLRAHINEIMLEKPTLPSSSMNSQVQSLFVDAFRRLEQQSGTPAPQIILIDGLDECNSETDQQTILELIGEIITVHALPLHFVIASRPEPQIRELFDGDVLRNITLQTTISEDLSSLPDIEMFLCEKLGEIYRRKSHLIDRFRKSNWPPDDIIKTLVHRSSGQFIYAITVIKFVDDKFSRPDDQLKILLSPQVSDRKAFLGLDSLYTHILSAYPDDRVENLKHLLGFVVALSRSSARLLEDLLQLQHGEVELLLGGLHSVLSGITSTKRPTKRPRHRTSSNWELNDLRSWSDYIQSMRFSNVRPSFFSASDPDLDITHASFIDFLLDPSRSGPYYIDSTESDIRIVTATFAMMSSFILNSLRGTFQRPFSIDTVISTEIILFPHLARLPSLPQRVLDEISEIEEAFRKTDHRPGSLIPVESFVGMYLFIMAASRKVADKFSEYKNQLLDLSNRFLKLLFLWSDASFPWDGDELSKFRGILVIQDDLSSEALADLFMVESLLVETFWKNQGLDIRICGGRSILARSLDFLSTLDSSVEGNRTLFKKMERRHLDLCHKLVLRFFSGSSLNGPQPHTEILKYMETHFNVHLDGLTLVASEMDSALEYVDILDEQIRDMDMMDISPNMLIGVWILIKQTLAWLSKMDTVNETPPIPSSFSERIRTTQNRLCRTIFCVNQSEHARNEIIIRRPFLEIEKSIRGSQSNHFRSIWSDLFIPSKQEPITASAIVSDVLEELLLPSCLSPDLFLLDFTDLKLDSYFTDVVHSGFLYLSSDKFYRSMLENLQASLTVVEEGHDAIQEAKRKSLVKACVRYLQGTRSCNSWINEYRPEWRRVGVDDRPTCGVLDWCGFVLNTLPSYHFYNLERQKVEDIVRSHSHSFGEE